MSVLRTELANEQMNRKLAERALADTNKALDFANRQLDEAQEEMGKLADWGDQHATIERVKALVPVAGYVSADELEDALEGVKR